jgi:hypothetical protein
VTGVAVGADGTGMVVGLYEQPSFVAGSRILRWSPDGVPSWQRELGHEGKPGWRWPAFARGVAIDGDGAAIVVGTTEPWAPGHLDLGQGVVNAHREAGFVAKLTPDGRAVWSRGTLRAEPHAVAVSSGRVLVGGTLECVPNTERAFVLSMDANTGVPGWTWRMAEGSWRASRVALAPGGEGAFLVWAWSDEPTATIGTVDPGGRAGWTRRMWPDDGPFEGLPLLAESAQGPVLLFRGRDTLHDLPDPESGSVSGAGGVLVGLAK